MQRKEYAQVAVEWGVNNRDPVVGGFDAHNSWEEYDTLFEGIDTSNMVALDFGCGPGKGVK